MGDSAPVRESAWPRGWRDFKRGPFSAVWFWVAEVFGGGLISAWSPLIALFYVAVLAAGAWLGVVLSAPRRQRDEAYAELDKLAGQDNSPGFDVPNGRVYAPPSRQQFVDTDEGKVPCEWFGNECFLERPVLRFDRCDLEHMVPQVVELGCSPYSFAKIRFQCQVPGVRPPPVIFSIRPVGSDEEPRLYGDGETEVRTNGKGQAELVVDFRQLTSIFDVCVRIFLVGWKERE